MDRILILSRSEERTLKSNARNTIGRLLLKLSESNTILTMSKPEVQKTLICPREGTAESSGVKDSAILLLKFSKSLLQMRETKNYCKQT